MVPNELYVLRTRTNGIAHFGPEQTSLCRNRRVYMGRGVGVGILCPPICIYIYETDNTLGIPMGGGGTYYDVIILCIGTT